MVILEKLNRVLKVGSFWNMLRIKPVHGVVDNYWRSSIAQENDLYDE